MDYKTDLAEIKAEIDRTPQAGKIATYIPELANIDPDRFGMSIYCLDGSQVSIGDATQRFSIQSIS